MKKKLQKIGVVTSPIGKLGIVPLSNLVAILHNVSKEVCVITGGKGGVVSKKYEKIPVFMIEIKDGKNFFTRILNNIYTQLKISFMLAKLSKNVNLWIFFFGGEDLIIPILTARLLRRRVILVLAGFPSRSHRVEIDPFSKVVYFLSKIALMLTNNIVAYSNVIIAERHLEKYRNKIHIAHEHFLDFDKFKVRKPVEERENLVGYIGGLGKGKGVPNFIEAIQTLVKWRNDVEFLIGGEGPLQTEIDEFANRENLVNRVKIVGWIPHDKLPKYLNELKLFVLPSYSEGLPNIVLEAMACGTPVLVTPVGAIPDFIKDGETGFIMKNNSSECIAKNIIRVLNHSNLCKIAENARELVGKEFTYEVAVEKYRKIIENI